MNTRNEEFKIPHAINKGYPFSGIPSLEITPNIDVAKNNEGKVSVIIDHGPETEETKALVQELKEREKDKRTVFEDFLMFRLYEMKEALKMAHGQIEDIMTEQPFIPEDFGFEIVHKQKSVAEQPQRIYTSKYNPNIALFRKPGDIHDENWNPSLWTLQVFSDGPEPVKDEEVLLPCHRIAYAYFYAKQIKVEEA